MKISDFLSPLDIKKSKKKKSYNSLESHIIKHTNEFPELEKSSVAIIGIIDAKDDKDYQNVYAIRKKLYELKLSKKMEQELTLYDLGNCIIDDGEGSKKITELGKLLFKHNVFPIFVGSQKKNIYSQYNMYEDLKNLITIAVIDKTFGLKKDKGNATNDNYGYKIITKKPNYLFNYSILGYQSFENNYEEFDLIDSLYFDRIRLGVIHDDIESTETIIRDADMLALSIDSLNGNIAPGQRNISPFGLTADQVVQMFWYGGQNEKLTSLGIYDYNNANDSNNITAYALAVAIWYFIEGFVDRKDSLDFVSNDYMIYHCMLEKMNEEIVFYKSLLSNKWWYRVNTVKNNDDDIERGHLVSCTYKDYIEATRMSQEGQIPDFYLKSIARLK